MSEEAANEKKRSFKVPFLAVSIIETIVILAFIALSVYFDVFYIEDLIIWDIRYSIETAAALLLLAAVVYYLVKRVHNERVSAIFCIIASGLLIKKYVYTMTYGDFILFIEAFLILLMSVLQIAFSVDLFRGKRDSAMILKVMMLVNILLVLGINILDFIRYGKYYMGDWVTFVLSVNLFPIIIIILAYVTLYCEGVLRGQKMHASELPRVPMLAGIMLLYGLIYLLDLQPVFAVSNTGFDLFTNIIFILAGLFFLLYRDVDVLSSVSILLLVIGLSSIIKSFPDIFTLDGLTMVLGIVTCLAGLACIVLCALMYSGDKFNTRRLQIIMLILLAVSVVPIIFDARINPDPGYLVETQSDRFLTAVLVGGTFIALTDKSIKYTGVKEMMAFNVHTMNNTICNDSNAYISRTELYKLYREDGWTYSDGPVEKEQTVMVYINDDRYSLTIRKWRDSEKITGEIHESNDGTYIQAMRFDIKSTVMDGTIEDCKVLTVYGDKGFFIIVPVSDEEVQANTKLPYKVFFKLIGHKNTKVIHRKFDESADD